MKKFLVAGIMAATFAVAVPAIAQEEWILAGEGEEDNTLTYVKSTSVGQGVANRAAEAWIKHDFSRSPDWEATQLQTLVKIDCVGSTYTVLKGVYDYPNGSKLEFDDPEVMPIPPDSLMDAAADLICVDRAPN